MTTIHLPITLRGDNKHRPLRLGLDLPSWFYSDIKAIDPKLHFVWHPWRVLYDNIMTNYTGDLEDSRFRIHEEHGHEIWGYTLKAAKAETPLKEAKWHLWRLCDPYGWAHVSVVEDKDPEYLILLGKRLHRQAVISDRYDQKEYARLTLKEQYDARIKAQENADLLYSDVQKENSWLTNSAMEGMLSGKTAPSNPTKDVIISYPGQKKRSKITRPITDKEGGLIVPEEWTENQ